MLRRLTLAVALATTSAPPARADEPSPPAQESAVRATLEVLTPTVTQAAELRVRVGITNAGPAEVVLDTLLFPYPSLLLELTDAAGKPVPKLPPPVPPEDPTAGRRPFAAGESVRLEYAGSEWLGLPLAPGGYRIRFRVPQPGGELVSAWGTFTVP